MISLNKKEVEKENILATLNKTFFKAGGYHIAINTVNSHLLKKAKENPSEHKELLVKISGYSTQFTRLDETIQDAVIERVN
jgi:formate C-acetyltransferase